MNEKSKLYVFIISGKSPVGDPGGYPAYSHTLSRILKTLGHDVNTFAIGKNQSIEKTKYGNVYVLTSKITKFFPFLQHLALAALPYYSLLFALRIKKLVQKKRIENMVLWGMGPWGFCGIFLRIILPKNVKTTIITSYFTSTRHEMKGALDAIRIKDYGITPKIRYFIVYEFIARVYNIFEKMTLDSCDAVVIHYNSSKRIIQKYFKVPDHKIIHFPWYNDIFKREGTQIKKVGSYRHPMIVSICRQDPRKGINFIIHAVKLVSEKYPKICCLIVGSGSFLQHNINLVKKLKMEKNITVTGFVPDINPILKEADIAVIVPLAQGSSALTVMEAMGYGKAVIGSDCDGIPEDITNNKNGIIVPKGNERELAKAMMKLIGDEALRKRLGENAKETYQNRFGFEKMKNNINNLLSNLPS